MAALDLTLIHDFTGGINAPAPTTDAGYDVRVNAEGNNLDYVPPAQSITGSGTWNGTSTCILVFGSGARTITVGRADIVGRRLEIVDAAGSSAAGTITIDPDGTDTINGASASITITSDWDSRALRYVAAGAWARTPG
jgi:hypothetical protein